VQRCSRREMLFSSAHARHALVDARHVVPARRSAALRHAGVPLRLLFLDVLVRVHDPDLSSGRPCPQPGRPAAAGGQVSTNRRFLSL